LGCIGRYGRDQTRQGADMDSLPIKSYTLRMAQSHFERLMAHLFPGDGDEHGAVVAAGLAETEDGIRLLAREVFLARDGIEYVPGNTGYRALTTDFVARVSGYCAKAKLAYFAVHCHGGSDAVAFSDIDMQSHRRGYPALLDIVGGPPVGALVFAKDAVAGQVWTRGGVVDLDSMTVIGKRHRRLYASRRTAPRFVDAVYDRQALLFGPAGQELLGAAKVGIIGLGGAGSLISEWLSLAGVGTIIGIDFDRMEVSNRARVVGATRWDTFGKAGAQPLALAAELRAAAFHLQGQRGQAGGAARKSGHRLSCNRGRRDDRRNGAAA
jgi:hypothetical protein